MNHEMRRKDREMTQEETRLLLRRGFTCRIGTTGPDGWPYVVPQLYIVHGDQVYFHLTTAAGHTRANIDANPRVCVEVDEPGPVFPYGELAQCETSIGFESVILFGTCREISEREEKVTFFEQFMAKYADPAWERPNVWPHLDATAVFAVTAERITGKRRPVVLAEKWKHMFPQVGDSKHAKGAAT